MAAYPGRAAAQKDFDALIGLAKEKKVRTEGVILVDKDANGNVTVQQTGDHLGANDGLLGACLDQWAVAAHPM